MLTGIVSQDFLQQLMLTLVASLGYFTIGLSRGWSGPAVPSILKLRPDVLIDPMHGSWVTAISPLGALTGSILGGPLLLTIGRKRTLQLVALLFVCGYLIIGSSQYFTMILIGRFVSGLCIGVITPAAQVYVSECSRAEVRGILGSLPSLFMAIGILVSYLIGTWLPWDWAAYVLCIFPFSLFFLMVPLPESPSWLFLKGKNKEAKAAMKWLNKTDYKNEIIRNQYTQEIGQVSQENINYSSSGTVDEEASKMHHSFIENLKNDFSELFANRHWLKPFGISVALLSFQQAVGSDVVIFNAVTIFREADTDIDDYLQTIVIGIVQVVATFVSLFMIDKFGRKPLLYFSGSLMCVSSAIVGIYFYFQDDMDHEAWKTLPLIGLNFYMTGFALGYLTIPYLIMGEMLPRKQRSILSSASGSISFLIMSVMLKTYPDIVRHTGNEAAFFIYAGFSLLSCVFVWLFVPETKGKTLKEIEDNF